MLNHERWSWISHDTEDMCPLSLNCFVWPKCHVFASPLAVYAYILSLQAVYARVRKMQCLDRVDTQGLNVSAIPPWCRNSQLCSGHFAHLFNLDWRSYAHAIKFIALQPTSATSSPTRGRDSNSDLSSGRRVCYHFATVDPICVWALRTIWHLIGLL